MDKEFRFVFRFSFFVIGLFFGAILLMFLLGGCTSVGELAKDKSDVCLGSIFPYGTIVGGRVNRPGSTLEMNGTSCKITTAPWVNTAPSPLPQPGN